jgi:hypothetical protein
MKSCLGQTCTKHLNSIQGSIYHKLWGDDVKYQGEDGADVGDDEDGVVDVIDMLPLCQGGVDGDDGGDFHPAAVADQPFWRWKKGSASAAALENYGENRVSLFCWNKGVHKKTEARRRSRGKQALVVRSAW